MFLLKMLIFHSKLLVFQRVSNLANGFMAALGVGQAETPAERKAGSECWVDESADIWWPEPLDSQLKMGQTWEI